jgi:transcriptional regulator with XRE-family HTH domain
MKAKKANMQMTKVELLKSFMVNRDLKPHPWAQKAGIRSSTIYNFLAGKSATLSSDTLEKLAQAAGATVDEILGRGASQNPVAGDVPLRFEIGINGRLFQMQTIGFVPRPSGVAAGVDLTAARVEGDGMHPLRAGWIFYFETAPVGPEKLVGKLAVVNVAGRSEPLVREVRRGSQKGLYALVSWNAGTLEDVEVLSGHRIVSITQPL